VKLLRVYATALGLLGDAATRAAVAITAGFPIREPVRLAYAELGRAIRDAFPQPPVLEAVLIGGFAAGCWGPPWRLDDRSGRLRALSPNRSAVPSTTSSRRVPP
jgi:hypothetical protein